MGAYQQQHRTELAIGKMQPLCDGTFKRRSVEEGEENVDIYEVMCYELVDEVWGRVSVCGGGRAWVGGIPLEVVERQ